MNLIRSVIYFVWLYGSIALVGVAFLPFAIVWRGAAFVAMRVIAEIAFFGLRWICGARVVWEGLENLPVGPAIIASKHQAMLDTMTPLRFVHGPAIVLKRELLGYPLFGWYMKRAGMIPIRREAQAKALREMLAASRAAIKDGRSILIFPEGTRRPPGAPPAYKPGVAALYRDLGVPCAPVAVNTGLIWPARGIMRKPGVARVRVLEPIAPGLSREEFMRELETRIETASDDLLPPSMRVAKP